MPEEGRRVVRGKLEGRGGGDISGMFELFDQLPNSRFKACHYNPFEVKHRRRTTAEQYRALETAFRRDSRPPLELRRQLAVELGMNNRAVQVWFQNRRAKLRAKGQTTSGQQGKRAGDDEELTKSASCPELARHFEELREALEAEGVPGAKLPTLPLHEFRTATRPLICAKQPASFSAELPHSEALAPLYRIDPFNLMPSYTEYLPLSPQSALLDELCAGSCVTKLEDDLLLDDLQSRLFALLQTDSEELLAGQFADFV